MKRYRFSSCGPTLLLTAMLAACASMGSPDGGPYDETPPVFLGSVPAPFSVNNQEKKVTLTFDEYIKIEKAAEKVVVSPPQINQPIIKTNGKKISVSLEDSLKANTTYTIDFSDAIVDNNEGNPLGNFSYTFSTGNYVDTMAVSGTVLDASNLEPVKGILVGLHANLNDSAFNTLPFDRLSRSDVNGRFTIRGIAPGEYRLYALQDANQNYRFDQKSEMLAFLDSLVIPYSEGRLRHDTIWMDSLTVDTILEVPYTHYLPDDLLLLAFTEKPTLRYLIKSERLFLNKFSLYFSTPADSLPLLEPLNFPDSDAFIVEANPTNDTIHYWMKDTLYYYQDTLSMALTYLYTDTLDQLVPRTDTLNLLPKKTRAKLLKEEEKRLKDRQKEREKRMRKGDTIPEKPQISFLPMRVKAGSSLDVYQTIGFSFEEPLRSMQDTMLHLFKKVDTLWVKEPFRFQPLKNKLFEYELRGEWKPDTEYRLAVDSAAFVGLYGLHTNKYETKFKFKSLDQYSTLYLTVAHALPGYTVQLLDKQDKVVRQAPVKEGTVSFFFLRPSTYYIRLFNDRNGNGIWDTGLYAEGRQAEEVYYFPGFLEMRENWDYDQDWDPTRLSVDRQKPNDLKKQKAEEKKKKSKNAEREEKKRTKK